MQYGKARLCFAFAGAVVLAACAEVEVGGVDGGGPGTGGMGPIVVFTDGSVPVPTNCGDGQRTKDEACDDGNREAGDGCAANCQAWEPGYSCIVPGKPCHQVARCGDGLVVPPELCDDGNLMAGDGCSATCKVELGSKCAGSPSVCGATTCGDGVIEGAESCDDKNVVDFDGCSSACQSEPNCKSASCMSRCGDGIVLDEACDDGNGVDGDGCSKDCRVEAGYECVQPALGESMMVPVVYRDFRSGSPADFEPGAIGQMTALTGIVEPTLDAEGKPVFTGRAGANVTSKQSFAQWYRDVPAVNKSKPSKLTLWNNGTGVYVNRWGSKGERWVKTLPAYWCGQVGQEMNGMPCTYMFGATDCTRRAAMGHKLHMCFVEGMTYKATFAVGEDDGNPVFFPVDDVAFTPMGEFGPGEVPPLYSGDGLTWEPEPGKALHNFHFTSEVRYWFKYEAGKTYKLDFTGDDDVWVFINGKLAVDLGGIHTPVQGSVTLNAQSAATFGLADGKVYEVTVFQAERQKKGSSYKLSLSGFSLAPSECRPKCGDGIVGIGEECDDGTNTGGYGQCAAGCKLGAYCGDGVLQPEHEDCDDGVKNGDKCPSGCRILIVL